MAGWAASRRVGGLGRATWAGRRHSTALPKRCRPCTAHALSVGSQPALDCRAQRAAQQGGRSGGAESGKGAAQVPTSEANTRTLCAARRSGGPQPAPPVGRQARLGLCIFVRLLLPRLLRRGGGRLQAAGLEARLQQRLGDGCRPALQLLLGGHLLARVLRTGRRGSRDDCGAPARVRPQQCCTVLGRGVLQPRRRAPGAELGRRPRRAGATLRVDVVVVGGGGSSSHF